MVASCASIPPSSRPISTIRPTLTCWNAGFGPLAGWSDGSRARARRPGRGSGTSAGRPGVGSSRSPGRCGGGPATRSTEVDRLSGEIAGIAWQALRDAAAIVRVTRRALACRPTDGWLRRLAADLDATVIHTQRLLAQTDLRLAGVRTIGNRLSGGGRHRR